MAKRSKLPRDGLETVKAEARKHLNPTADRPAILRDVRAYPGAARLHQKRHWSFDQCLLSCSVLVQRMGQTPLAQSEAPMSSSVSSCS